MSIDTSGMGRIGSDPADIEDYLRHYSEDSYSMTWYAPIKCECGADRFMLQRAGWIICRECAKCTKKTFVCRTADDWEEAIDEEEPEFYECDCGSRLVNIGIGLARFADFPDEELVRWFYLGDRCVGCGVLGSFGDGKMYGETRTAVMLTA